MWDKPGVFVAPISSYGKHGRDEKASYAAVGRRNRSSNLASSKGAALGIWQRKGTSKGNDQGAV
jgi:hypothetical protein